MRNLFVIASVMIISCVNAAAHAVIIFVDDSADGTNTGVNWSNAYTDLQSALAIAKRGDEIRVAQGVYKPAPPEGFRTASFHLVNGTTLAGGYAGTGAPQPNANDPEKFPTLLSGDLNGDDGATQFDDNSYHVVRATDVDNTTVLSGVVVTRGRAVDGLCSESTEYSRGGGMRCENADLLIDHCIFRNNRASCAGGGVHMSGGASTIRDCQFRSNFVTASDHCIGGGLYAVGDHTFTNCEFIENICTWDAGGVRVSGAELRSCTSRLNSGGEFCRALSAFNARLVDCIFDQNSSFFTGGVGCSNTEIVNCTFTNHHYSSNIYLGNALRALGNSRVTNCTFTGNETPAVALFGSNVLTNVSIVGNEGEYYGGLYVGTGELTLINSILWDNLGDHSTVEKNQVFVTVDATVNIHQSAIHGWSGTLGGINNNGNNPRFIDADGPDNIYGTSDDNVRLLANSPCIDSGDASFLPPDTFDLDEDGDLTEPLPVDLDFNPRLIGANLDRGAFEFQGTPCRADIDGNATVNVDDLLSIIPSWGPCAPGEECNSDLDLNNAVDVDDLLRVITSWGPCA